MFFKIFLFIALMVTNSFAYCVYVDCTDGVTNASSVVENRLTETFNKINKNMNEIQKLYIQKQTALHENNILYKKIFLLKREYLLNLKEINFELSKQKEIK